MTIDNLTRREFLGLGIVTGIILAVPELVFGGGQTHIANMYPWDGVYTKKSNIYNVPGIKDKSFIMRPSDWKSKYSKHNLRKYFKDEKKMDLVTNQITDGNIKNDELGMVVLTNKGIAFRILTKDKSFSDVQSKSKEDINKYGEVMVYVVFDYLDKNEIKQIRPHFS